MRVRARVRARIRVRMLAPPSRVEAGKHAHDHLQVGQRAAAFGARPRRGGQHVLKQEAKGRLTPTRLAGDQVALGACTRTVLDGEVVVEVGLVEEDHPRLQPLHRAGAHWRELGHERRRRVQPASLEGDRDEDKVSEGALALADRLHTQGDHASIAH